MSHAIYTKKNISEMNKAAEDAIAQLKQEKNKKINLFNKEKDSLSIQLENARTQNKRNIKAFLERAKREIDDALNTYIDHRVGKKKDFSATNALPEQICVGQHYTKTKSCELSTVLYGSKAVGSSNPILLDVRNNGNIIINASTNDENDEDLYRAVCGLTMKYLEEFPLGALKVHLVDANQHVWFYKIKNAFSNKDSVACKQLITFDSKINSRIESINRDCSEFIMELINGDIQDSYDLYTIDRTHAFHLFVLRSGFSEIVDSGNIETLRLLKNLMGEFGAKCGVRFIIVNDYIENERTDTKKIQLVNDILDSGISVDFEEGKFFANDSEISISYIEEDDADYFIERQCNTMANILGAKKAESLTYDFTNLFANNGRGESSMIDTVLSNWKTSDSTNKLDIPFSILLPAKRPFKVTNLSIGEMGVHALITGMNGSGKSTLLHMLIMSIVSKYDPDDVEIWLLDYGINEFKDYANNRPPHVRFVALEKSQDFTFSFLNYLDKIRMERENLFRGENGVASLKDYRKKHGKLSLPRIVVIMDEFHVMTQHILYNTKYVRSLENALTEGRKYGFSFIFANQTMSGLEGLTTTARDQIGTRIAMNNSISELYYSLELAKMSRVEAFAMKAQVGEFLFRDSNSEIREAKGIYISKETRENLLKAIKNKNIRPRVDANVFVLNGEERLPVPAQDIERNITLYEGPTTRIYLGSPCSIEKECWIDIKARYDENLLVIGKDSMMPDIFLTILYSLVAKPENQLVLVADPYEESLSRYKEANKHLFGNRLRIIDDYEGICDFVKQVREEMRVSRTRVNNMFIFWLGIRDIFTEIQHYSKEKVDNRAIQSGSDIANENAQYDANGNRTSSSKSNSKEPIYVDEDVIKNNAELMAKAREFGLSPEELMGSLVSTNNLSKFNNINSPVINTHVEKASLSNGDCLYNASEDIAQIIAMGSRQRIHSLLHTDSYSAFNMLQIIKKNSFAHVITTEISQEERARWAFPTNSTVLQSGISAQYISGDTTKTFKPYIIDFK